MSHGLQHSTATAHMWLAVVLLLGRLGITSQLGQTALSIQAVIKPWVENPADDPVQAALGPQPLP